MPVMYLQVIPKQKRLKANAHFRSQSIDVIGSGIDISTLPHLRTN